MQCTTRQSDSTVPYLAYVDLGEFQCLPDLPLHRRLVLAGQRPVGPCLRPCETKVACRSQQRTGRKLGAACAIAINPSRYTSSGCRLFCCTQALAWSCQRNKCPSLRGSPTIRACTHRMLRRAPRPCERAGSAGPCCWCEACQRATLAPQACAFEACHAVRDLCLESDEKYHAELVAQHQL
jgi:hypothetical protein